MTKILITDSPDVDELKQQELVDLVVIEFNQDCLNKINQLKDNIDQIYISLAHFDNKMAKYDDYEELWNDLGNFIDFHNQLLKIFDDNQEISFINLLNYDKQDINFNYIYNNACLSIYQSLNLEYFHKNKYFHTSFYDVDSKYMGPIIHNSFIKSSRSYYYFLDKNLKHSRILKTRSKQINKVDHSLMVDDRKKVAIITGASGGIGYMVAKKLISNNWRVYSLSRQAKEDKDIIYVECDLKTPADIKKKVKEIINNEPFIDLLVNNAGIGQLSSMNEANLAAFKDVYKLNVVAPIVLSKLLSDKLSISKGSIINLNSIASFINLPYEGLYCLSKQLLLSYFDSYLDNFNKKGISIGNIVVGPVRSNFEKNKLTANVDDRALKLNGFLEWERQRFAIPTKWVANSVCRWIKKSKKKTIIIPDPLTHILKFVSKISTNKSMNRTLYYKYLFKWNKKTKK
ncbi:SDR family NAD(P)-dependent oxidoreductase [Mycoplasma sp. E35C]|uniref:SDR family NAD(P)-dependent oxidoreductase n=1 Tax=Mycoplasma sp. E35C TaxID=2801918 RepID=UPI001CA3BCD5|nr:SDR family NAD(P)-dependent oxidoreductase [Mycoplasma sp. E35C]QZX49126.1 SDR family NAD(P)-dependent oxidoreductase [Mycoplasma sp. E35C]